MKRLMMANLRKFMKAHQCRFCLYRESSEKCFVEDMCYYDSADKTIRKKQIASGCFKDVVGNCPYGNRSGTCFGYCLQNILIEFRERKQKCVQSEEEENE